MTRPLTNEELLAMPLESRIRALAWEALRWAIDRRHSDRRPATVQEAVHNVRKRSGLTLREFATRVGSNHSTIAQMESGQRNTTPAVLRRLADLAERSGMDKHAQYFLFQCQIRESEIRKRGGKLR